MPKSTTEEAIVLKRYSYKEADRIVVFFSRHRGKFSALAKGARLLHSRKKSTLEIGTHGKYHFIRTKSFPLVTQSVILNSYPSLKTSLPRLTQLNQILEIADLLTTDDQENQPLYELLKETLDLLARNGKQKSALLNQIQRMMVISGFSTSTPKSENYLLSEIEAVAERRLRAKTFLTPNLKSLTS